MKSLKFTLNEYFFCLIFIKKSYFSVLIHYLNNDLKLFGLIVVQYLCKYCFQNICL